MNDTNAHMNLGIVSSLTGMFS